MVLTEEKIYNAKLTLPFTLSNMTVTVNSLTSVEWVKVSRNAPLGPVNPVDVVPATISSAFTPEIPPAAIPT